MHHNNQITQLGLWVCVFPEQEVPLMSVPVLISKVIPVTASANMATTTMVSRQMQENAFGGFYDYNEKWHILGPISHLKIRPTREPFGVGGKHVFCG